MGALAQQFGQATGKRGALRSALGELDAQGNWQRKRPSPSAYHQIFEPHERGAILVAAVFDAFLTIYKKRAEQILCIASGGTGVLPDGFLHPDLVDRLTEIASSTSGRVLNMCIRALDYCPPVDLTFGEYLRALVTADYEFDPVDADNHRVAFVESFRRHGLMPHDVHSISVDGLLWRPTSAAPGEDESICVSLIKRWAADISHWNLSKSRSELYDLMKPKRAALHKYLGRVMKKRELRRAASISDAHLKSIPSVPRIEWTVMARHAFNGLSS